MKCSAIPPNVNFMPTEGRQCAAVNTHSSAHVDGDDDDSGDHDCRDATNIDYDDDGVTSLTMNERPAALSVELSDPSQRVPLVHVLDTNRQAESEMKHACKYKAWAGVCDS